jgi:hypothetical protein
VFFSSSLSVNVEETDVIQFTTTKVGHTTFLTLEENCTATHDSCCQCLRTIFQTLGQVKRLEILASELQQTNRARRIEKISIRWISGSAACSRKSDAKTMIFFSQFFFSWALEDRFGH